MFGGQLQLVIRDIDSQVSFVGGGQQVCFLRHDPSANKNTIVLADAATGQEKTLLGNAPIYLFSAAVACSADGTKVAMAFNKQVDVIDISHGQIGTVTHLAKAPSGSNGSGDSIVWMPGESGLDSIGSGYSFIPRPDLSSFLPGGESAAHHQRFKLVSGNSTLCGW